MYNLMRDLNPWQSPGPDKISPMLLVKEIAGSIIHPLQMIYYLSLNTGKVSTRIKVEK